jgi:hypothetical protein
MLLLVVCALCSTCFQFVLLQFILFFSKINSGIISLTVHNSIYIDQFMSCVYKFVTNRYLYASSLIHVAAINLQDCLLYAHNKRCCSMPMRVHVTSATRPLNRYMSFSGCKHPVYNIFCLCIWNTIVPALK